MDFIAGLIIGIILMMVVSVILGIRIKKVYEEEELQYKKYIQILHETITEMIDANIEGSQELCKKADEIEGSIYEL